MFAVSLILTAGCITKEANLFKNRRDRNFYESVATRVDYPENELACQTDFEMVERPHTIRHNATPTDYLNLSLSQAVEYALENSEVLRDLGGTILRSPELVRTGYIAGIQASDPRFGAEAALSAFDAQFSTSAFFENNDRQLNNTFFGGGTRILQQDVNDYQAQISKLSATGGEFALRSTTNYDNNNAPGNAFPHAWTTTLEGEIRQPLLQGAGVEFNRIAGPSRVPGLINGVMVSRVNNKISQADFQVAVRNYVSNVGNAYWDLYFAYRNLDARIQARNRALDTWQIVKSLKEQERRGGEADKEALAREQYYRFQEEVQNALSGRQEDGTRTGAGSTGGAFRGTGGVHIAERRLRLLMGVPITEDQLIRPTNEPEIAQILFDWDSIVAEAHSRRPELKRQRLLVERREMELLANRNFLTPRLDAVGLYRWRGFGRDLLEQGGNNNAFDDLTGGAFQEWQLGVELDVPIGFRRGHAAVQNSELLLARSRAILREQERQIGHDLSDAIGELDRAYVVCQTNLNRYRAAKTLLDTLEAIRESGRTIDVDRILDAQNRVASAETRYFLSRVEYALAIKNVNFEKGSLMDYHNVFTTDGFSTVNADGKTKEPGSEKSKLSATQIAVPPQPDGPIEQTTFQTAAKLNKVEPGTVKPGTVKRNTPKRNTPKRNTPKRNTTKRNTTKRNTTKPSTVKQITAKLGKLKRNTIKPGTVKPGKAKLGNAKASPRRKANIFQIFRPK